ncbi:MAG: hypothetical protein QOG48_2013 [Verrucomicrobiota bacterium]|jgi:hypothetical protein
MLAAVRLPRKIDIEQTRQGVTRFAQSERGRDAICIALVFALVAVMLRRCLRGDYPIGHDHPVHLFRIWQFGHTLLHHPFSPWTWSHAWFAGYPQNVVYPIGADLLVLGIRALSLGTLSLGYSYALAFFFFYFALGSAIYLFVRRAVQSHVAALIAVVFLLTDPGSNDIGGWFYTVDVGVWAAPLGVAPMLIALLQINALFDKIDNRRIVIAAVSIGAAFLCHPLHLIFVAIALPLLCVCRYITGAPTPWPRCLLAISIIVIIAVLIASYWLVPYIAATPYALDLGEHGQSLKKIGGALSDGKFFNRMNPFAAAFGFVGAISLLGARRTLALFMSIFVFVAIVLSSTSFAAFFGEHVALWLDKHIIVTRLLMLAKPFWYGAAGFGMVATWRMVQSLGKHEGAADEIDIRRHAALTALVAVIVGPLAFYFLASFVKWEVKRPTVWMSDRKDRRAREDFIAWTRTSLDRQQGFFRIAHGFEANDHDFADLAIEVPYPFYKIDHTPTGHFKYQINSSSQTALRATNVRYALSHVPLSARPDLTLLKTFRGKILLYEFRDWNPMPFEINGSGAVELVSFGDDEIVLRAGAGAQGTLRLNVSSYPKWHATRDGAALPITTVKLPGVEHSAFMQVPLGPGTIRFRYVKTASDYVGTLLSLFGIGGCVALLKSDRLDRWLRLPVTPQL